LSTCEKQVIARDSILRGRASMIDEPSSTQALLTRLRQGDREALAQLFDYYRPRLRHMVRLRMDARLAARLDASDVLQEAYLDASRQVPRSRRQSPGPMSAWPRGLTPLRPGSRDGV